MNCTKGSADSLRVELPTRRAPSSSPTPSPPLLPQRGVVPAFSFPTPRKLDVIPGPTRSSRAECRNSHVVDRFRRLRRSTGVERWMRVVFDGELNGLRDFGPGNVRREGERKVYPRGDPGAGHDAARGDHALFGWHGTVGGEFVVGAPVCGGGQTVEQPGGAE